jgi:hypothetical protein
MRVPLALAMFWSLLLFAAAYVPTAQQFVSVTTEPGDVAQITLLRTHGVNYSLISINGNETFIFDPAAGAEVNGSAEAVRILTEDVYIRAGFDGKIASYHAAIAAFSAGKRDDEAQCRQLLGTDKLPCTDRESCVRACFAVPLCAGVVNADQFWQSSRNWTNDTSSLNSATVDFEKNLDEMREGGVRIQEKIAILDDMLRLTGVLYDNPIVLNRTDSGCGEKSTKKCFEYCKHPDYQVQELQSMRSSLITLKNDLDELSRVQSRASAILSSSAAQRAYLSSRGGKWDDLRMHGRAEIERLNESYANISGIVRYADAEAKINASNDLYLLMLYVADAGSYRRALGMQNQLGIAIDGANGKIREAADRRALVQGKLSDLSIKLNKSRALIGNESAAPIDEEISSLSSQLSNPLDYEQLPGFEAAIDGLDASLNDLIVNATVAGEEKPESGASKLPIPCPVATGLVLGIGLLATINKDY